MNRADFPILKETVHGRPLVYLDNAATSQKPQVVMDAITEAYSHWNSNIHRGVHHLSQIATFHHEAARQAVAFLPHRCALRRRRTHRRTARHSLGSMAYTHTPVPPRLRRRSDALCGSRRTHPRSLAGHPFQPLHHRFRPRLRPYDGPRCGVGVKEN